MAEKPEVPRSSRRRVSEKAAEKEAGSSRGKGGNKTAEKEQKEHTAEAARRFKALGEPTRLRIVQFLRSCWEAHGPPPPPPAPAPPAPADSDEKPTRKSKRSTSSLALTPPPYRGVCISDICRQVTGGEKLSSTFSHHIKELRRAGLIEVERDGKNRWCRLEPGALDALLPFLIARNGHETSPLSPNGAEEGSLT